MNLRTNLRIDDGGVMSGADDGGSGDEWLVWFVGEKS